MDSFASTCLLVYRGINNQVLPHKRWVCGICQLCLLKVTPTKCHRDPEPVQTPYSSLCGQPPVHDLSLKNCNL